MTVGSMVNQTLATLKGVQGTLRIYSAQSQKEETKSAFIEALSITDTVIKDIENRLTYLEFQEPQYKSK